MDDRRQSDRSLLLLQSSTQGPCWRAGKGCIVNISSQSARLGSKGLSPAYNASKAGVLGLTMGFSAQVADLGVRVNAVMPGLVESRDFGMVAGDPGTPGLESTPWAWERHTT